MENSIINKDEKLKRKDSRRKKITIKLEFSNRMTEKNELITIKNHRREKLMKVEEQKRIEKMLGPIHYKETKAK